jgi:hypothetical protein
VLGGANDKRGFNARDIRRGRQLVNDEVLKRRQIRRHASQHEINLAREHVAVADDRRIAHALLEGDEIGLRLAVETDHGEGGHAEAKRSVVKQRRIAADETNLLKRADAAKARRCRDTDLAGEIDIGDAAVSLQLAQDAPVGGVESG